MELDGKVHVGNLCTGGLQRVQACSPLWKAALDPAGLQARPDLGRSLRDLSLCSSLFTEQVWFGHRYLQILFRFVRGL